MTTISKDDGGNFKKQIVPGLSKGVAECLDLKARGRLMDFVPEIKENEMHILDTWITHFTELKIPFVVTYDGRKYKLWKERR